MHLVSLVFPLVSFVLHFSKHLLGLPWRLSGKEPTCQCRRHGFDAWSGKIPQAKEELSLGATAEPVLSSLGAVMTEAQALWSLCSVTGEAGSLQVAGSPRQPQLEKSLSSNKDPAQPKINFKKKEEVGVKLGLKTQ